MHLRMKLPSLDKNAVAYASVAFANAMMNPLFNFYYVKLFLNSYKISEVWFNQAQITTLLLSPVVERVGSYRVILASFHLELVCAVGMFLAGPQPWLIILYLLMDMSIPGAIFNLFNISVSDIIDADCKKYARKTPLSSMFFGMNALFTKPAQSLAPMLVVSILNRYGYEDLVRSTTELGTSTAGHDELRQVMFHIFCLLPATIAFLQILVWKPYSLKDSHASTAKHIDT
ncbi:MFS/sugar transport protein [Branchiostoma belcheri]|nr:MFS/sugar transport protein [Branchiostoma belcheri]